MKKNKFCSIYLSILIKAQFAPDFQFSQFNIEVRIIHQPNADTHFNIIVFGYICKLGNTAILFFFDGRFGILLHFLF